MMISFKIMMLLNGHCFTQGPEDEQTIREELMCLAAKYYEIGITLGLSSNELEVIAHECVRDVKRALGRVIQTWLSQSYNVARFGLPSWRALVKAIDSSAGGSNHALAKRIASKHTGRVNYQSFKSDDLHPCDYIPAVRKRNHDNVDNPHTKIPRIEGNVL